MISYEEWSSQFVNFNVYCPQLKYTLVQEIPAMTIIGLISSIGGSMGLIVGVTFFTILEIGEIFALVLHVLIFSKNSSNKVST